jgi:hypothetical protein
MHSLLSSTCGHSVLAAVTKPVHAISNRRLNDFISSRENQVLQCPVMTFYARFTYSLFWHKKLSSARWYHKYRELPDIDITNTGNCLALISRIQGTVWHWYHKYRELPHIDVTNKGTTCQWNHKYRELPDIDIINTGSYLTLISQINGTTWNTKSALLYNFKLLLLITNSCVWGTKFIDCSSVRIVHSRD